MQQQFRPKFTITADLDSKYVLDSVQSYFQQSGKININIKNHSAEYVVERLGELKTIIIPHFKKYPLFCAKLRAYEFFDKLETSLFDKKTKSLEERRNMLIMALSMNGTTNRNNDRINLLFSMLDIPFTEGHNKINKHMVEKTSAFEEKFVLSSEFISGMIDGDGSFYISFQKNGTIKTGFSITCDIASKPLLEVVSQNLNGIGSILETNLNRDYCKLTVTGLNQIIDVLIPFMDKNPLLSERASHYSKFREVSLVLKLNNPLSLDKKLEIVEKNYDMNKKGKRRKLNKTEYIKHLLSLP